MELLVAFKRHSHRYIYPNWRAHTMHNGTTPLWLKNSETHDFANLRDNATCNVCVVGGGVTGLVTAYELSRAGLSVIITDDGPIAGGQTMRTTAHLSTVLDKKYVDLSHLHDKRDLTKVVNDHIDAIDYIQDLIQRESIPCDFARIPGKLFALDVEAQGEKILKSMQTELEQMHALGLTEATIDKNSIVIPHQARLHPLMYMTGLIKAVKKNGGKIYTQTHILDIKPDKHKYVLSATNDCTITADWVIVATGSPVFESPVLDTKLTAYRTYVIACELLDVDAYPDALLWSYQDDEPYHYIRTQHMVLDGVNKPYLMIGGGDHRVGHKQNYDEIFDDLENFARKLPARLGPVEYRWSGQVVEPVDGLPFIGRATNLGDRVLFATGLSGMGMTQSAIAAKVCAEIILAQDETERQTALKDHTVYSLDRKRLSATGDYIKENWNTACQYLDHLNLAAQIEDPGEMPEDEGAVITHNLNKVAVYKGTNGMIRACQAVCPHAKAIIRWNALEKSFDCPAHGSRFACTGQVIDGPANQDLSACELTSAGDASQVLGFSLGANLLATDS